MISGSVAAHGGSREREAGPSRYVRGFLRASVGWDWTGAQAHLEKALAFDPGDSTVQRRYGDVLHRLGRLAEAIVALMKSTELDPLSSPAWENLGISLVENGQSAAAGEALHRALEIQPESLYALNNLGTLQLLEGSPAQAAAYQIAQVYAWRGEKDKAFDGLERAYRQRDGGLTFIKVDLLLAALRRDAEEDAAARVRAGQRCE